MFLLGLGLIMVKKWTRKFVCLITKYVIYFRHLCYALFYVKIWSQTICRWKKRQIPCMAEGANVKIKLSLCTIQLVKYMDALTALPLAKFMDVEISVSWHVFRLSLSFACFTAIPAISVSVISCVAEETLRHSIKAKSTNQTFRTNLNFVKSASKSNLIWKISKSCNW